MTRSTTADAMQPLRDLKVVDFTELLPGPFLSHCLAELGASVMKIERPGGDGARTLSPGIFAAMNRGKQNLRLDLKDPSQRHTAWQQIEQCDIVLEGYRPGVMKRLGLDYASVHSRNPRAIYVSLTGYGQNGQDAGLPSHDINFLSIAGVSALSGAQAGPPAHDGALPIGDLASALYGLSSLLAAVHSRDRSGEGAYLDVAASDCLVHMMNTRRAEFASAGRDTLETQRAALHQKPAYGLFRTNDEKYISLGALEDHFWLKLVTALQITGIPSKWNGHLARSADAGAVNDLVSRAIGEHPLKELTSLLREHDVPHAPVIAPSDLERYGHHADRKLFDVPLATDTSELSLARFPVRFQQN